MNFAPVWLSSPQHLESVAKVFLDASWATKLFGHHRLPDDLPQLSIGWCPPLRRKVPAILIASGEIRLDDDVALTFRSLPLERPLAFRLSNTRLHGLHQNAAFSLSKDDVISVETFRLSTESRLMNYFSLSWIRLRTVRDGALSNILLAAGGLGPSVGALRRRTAELREAVETWHEVATHGGRNRSV